MAPLVDYPSSDDAHQADNEKSPARSPKRSAAEPPSANVTPNADTAAREQYGASDMPPLPSGFHDMYASNVRTSTRDDPSLHGGRQRITPHVQGNWAAHVYIEWIPSGKAFDLLNHAKLGILQGEFSTPGQVGEIHSLLKDDTGVTLPLHVSLSRSIGFLTEDKDEFVRSLEKTLKSSSIPPFEIQFIDLVWHPNYERTRWFLVLQVHRPPGDELNKLLHLTNTVVQQHGKPPLYVHESSRDVTDVPPVQKGDAAKNSRPFKSSRVDWSAMQDCSDSFHVSIAWTLMEPSEELLKATEIVSRYQSVRIQNMIVTVDSVKFKVGNMARSVALSRIIKD